MILDCCYSVDQIMGKIMDLARNKYATEKHDWIMGNRPPWQKTSPLLSDSIKYYVLKAREELEKACAWSSKKDQNELVKNMSQLTILNSVFKDY